MDVGFRVTECFNRSFVVDLFGLSFVEEKATIRFRLWPLGLFCAHDSVNVTLSDLNLITDISSCVEFVEILLH
jgi:hypothetical protein